MSSILAICDHTKPPISPRDFDQVIDINQYDPKRNLRLQVLNLSHWLLKSLKPVTRDLLDLAAFVYIADTSVSRGTTTDVFGEKWIRRFTFVLPVRELDLWQDHKVSVS
jgi:hypothetical protein